MISVNRYLNSKRGPDGAKGGPDCNQQMEEQIVRQVLARLAPFLAILYVFNLIDRGNVSIAVFGMQRDLGFSDTVYGLGAGMFFVGYFFFEVPSNLVMEKVGARRWIARIMLTWGLVSGSTMFVHSALSFYILRFLLGVAEAGFYPGIILYLTYWAPATARARVIARFLALTAFLGLFGGPLGGELLKLDGKWGLAGWQWLFLLEGIPSVILSGAVLRWLPDRPSDVIWLSPDEKQWLAERLADEESTGARVQRLSWRVALSDPRILMMCLIFILTATAGNAVGFFGPQLIKVRSLNTWTDASVARMTVVPGLVGAAGMLLAAIASDRSGRRVRHVVVGYSIAAVGFLLCVFSPTAPLTLAALSINALGERIGAGSYWAITTNLMGARAAAGGIALINCVGNLGGFFGPALMGKLKTATHGGFTAGLATAAALMLLAAVLTAFLPRLTPVAPSPAPVSEEGPGKEDRSEAQID